MDKIRNILNIGKQLYYTLCIINCALIMGCADNDITGEGRDAAWVDPVGQPVLFSSGNMAEVRTRSDALGSASPYYHGMTNTSGVPYMALDGRFVCTMYYHAKATDTDASEFDIKDIADGGTMTTAWLKVNNNVGNSVYWNKEYSVVDASELDEYGFDKSATMFYWQNRLTHAFLALADYNKLSDNDGANSDQGKLKMYPNWDKDFAALPTDPQEVTPEQQAAFDNKLLSDRYANAYDLTRGEIWAEREVQVLDEHGDPVLDENDQPKMTTETYFDGYTINSISGQPDPILALTIMKPAGATQEANRVHLYFKHQFSLIQVNLKGADDNSANITTDQIDGVQLLGVSTEGYVCNRLNADGTVGAASAKDVHLDEFSDEVLEDNKWGTSFQMFDMASGDPVDVDGDGIDDRYATGFLKSFNAIAFGNLWAIRITWHEGTTDNPGIKHITTFEVPQTNEENVQLRNLQSGTKYIYDLELRRGTLAVIRTQVRDWMQKEDLVYGSDGTIQN